MILCESIYDQKLNDQILKRVYRFDQQRIVIYCIFRNDIIIEKLIKQKRKNKSDFEERIFIKLQKKNDKNVIAEGCRDRFCRKSFNCDVENYLNVCNDIQAGLFNKIKILFLIDYWVLSVKWLIIIRDFFKNSVKTLSRFWRNSDKSLFNEILINLYLKSRQYSNQSWIKILTRSRSILT